MYSRLIKVGVALWLSAMVIFAGGCGENSLQRLEQDLASVVDQAGPSVVCIMGQKEGSGEVKFGSGVILDKGHILTTENILHGVDKITIKLQDGQVIEDHEIVAMLCDFETNVSLIEVGNRQLQPVRIMQEEEISNGCLGIALGNTNYSKGLDVNLGTVSRSWIGGADAYDESLLMWHGPPVAYHGGTPIFNRKGELLGLTEGRPEGEEGMVFILPAKTCSRVSDLLKKEGKVRRGWIGIYCERPAGKCEKGEILEGATIKSVVEGSPAFRAGLSAGDRVTGFNGKPVKRAAELRKLVSATDAGSHVLLSIVRGGEKKTADVLVQTMESDGMGMRRCPHKSI
jgi:serine protease Do